MHTPSVDEQINNMVDRLTNKTREAKAKNQEVHDLLLVRDRMMAEVQLMTFQLGELVQTIPEQDRRKVMIEVVKRLDIKL